MFLVALLLASAPLNEHQLECRRAHERLENYAARFGGIVRRAENRDEFSADESRVIQHLAVQAARPFLNDIREIAETASGDLCQQISLNGRQAVYEVFLDFAEHRAERRGE